MPQVPQYTDRQVKEQPLSPARAQTMDASSGLRSIASGLNDTASAFNQVAEKQEVIAAQDAETKIRTEFQAWSAEEQKKYVGEKAPQWKDAVAGWWKGAENKYGQGLSGYSRQLIGSRLRANAGDAVGNAASWGAQEQMRHATSVFGANVESIISSGIADGKPDRAEKELTEAVAQQASTLNYSPKEAEALTRKVQSQLWQASLLKQMETDAQGAQVVFDAKVKAGLIDTESQNQLRDALKQSGDLQFARQFAIDVQHLGYAEQVSKAQAIKDPMRQQRALAEVDANESRKLRMEAYAEKKAQEHAVDIVNRGGTPTVQEMMAMSPPAAMTLQKTIDARNKTGGPPRIASREGTQLYMDMVRAPLDTVREWNPVLLSHAQAVMTATQYSEVQKRWSDYQDASPAGAGESRSGMISNALRGLEPKSKYSDDPEAWHKETELYQLMSFRINKAVDDAEKSSKRGTLSSTEMREVIEPFMFDKLHAPNKGISGGYESDETPRASLSSDEFMRSSITVDDKQYPISTVDEDGTMRFIAPLSKEYAPIIDQYMESTGMEFTIANRIRAYNIIQQRVLEKKAKANAVVQPKPGPF